MAGSLVPCYHLGQTVDLESVPSQPSNQSRLGLGSSYLVNFKIALWFAYTYQKNANYTCSQVYRSGELDKSVFTRINSVNAVDKTVVPFNTLIELSILDQTEAWTTGIWNLSDRDGLKWNECFHLLTGFGYMDLWSFEIIMRPIYFYYLKFHCNLYQK